MLNPSILTAAGFCMHSDREHLLLFRRDDAEYSADGDNKFNFWFPNWASWVTGFEARHGGDPIKNGGEQGTS